mgnify:CR=1 FL=1
MAEDYTTKKEVRIYRTIEEVKDVIYDIVAEQFGKKKEDLPDNLKFVKDLGADSLATLKLQMELEDKFDLDIPEEDLEEIQTIGQTADYVWNQKKGE